MQLSRTAAHYGRGYLGSKAVAEIEIALPEGSAADPLIGTFVHKQKQAKNCTGQRPLTR